MSLSRDLRFFAHFQSGFEGSKCVKEGGGKRMSITGFLLAMDRGGVTLWDLQQPFMSQAIQSGPTVREGGP